VFAFLVAVGVVVQIVETCTASIILSLLSLEFLRLFYLHVATFLRVALN